MREVIEKIIATEGEAKLIVESAKTEADRMLAEAREKGRDIVEKARQEALVEAGKLMEAAVESAEQEKVRRLADAAVEVQKQIQLDEVTKKSAVEGVVRCVCKQP